MSYLIGSALWILVTLILMSNGDDSASGPWPKL